MRARITNTSSIFFGKTGDVIKRLSRGLFIDIDGTGDGLFFRHHEVMEASDDALFGIGMEGGEIGKRALGECTRSRKIDD
jgi:hypothetical protein